MGKNERVNIRNLVIYEVFVRNHGANGTFLDVENDLERIKSMNVDFVWFMPIHPIGAVNRKGTLGCPYSIVDYREVNPEYGTKEDFRRLIDKAHHLGLKVMIDVVYNHTAHESPLVAEHPEWYHQDKNAKAVTTVPDWSDVIDLKHPNPDLTKYLIKTLQGWVKFGVDGFRCDVASLVPLDFWRKARKDVDKVKPGVVWLAESVHAGFVEYRRAHGLSGISDSELYLAFDLTYDYDIFPIWERAVKGLVPVSRYLDMLRFQNCIYPEKFVKMRCVENHDQPRILESAPTRNQALAWTAFEAFNNGAFLIYAGQESAANHPPSLFDSDPIQWGSYELQGLMSQLAHLKKDPAQMHGQFVLLTANDPIEAIWYYPPASLYGIFNVREKSGPIPVSLPDGVYTNLLTHTTFKVSGGKIPELDTSAIVRYNPVKVPKPYKSELLTSIHQE